MSEFSESYHLYEASQDDAVQLLQRAGLKGIIFPSNGHWTSFVPTGQDWEGLEAIVQANRELLLHYSYAEDHGWSIEIYKNVERQMAFQYWWDNSLDEDFDDLDATRPPNNPDFDLLSHWVPPTSESIEALRECLTTDGGNKAYDFANLIGLEYFKWLSPNYWSNDPGSFRTSETIEV